MRKIIISLFVLSLFAGCERVHEPSMVHQRRISNELVKKANDGDSNAQFELGKQKISLNTDEGRKEGFSWICRAATNGLVKAQCYVGASYFKGEIVERDLYDAKEWLEKAAGSGDAIACRMLGYIKWEMGNYDEAINYFNMGMRYGDAITMCYGARLCLYDNPINENDGNFNGEFVQKAYGLFAEAAEKGNYPARHECISLLIALCEFERAEQKFDLWFDGNDAKFMFLQAQYYLAVDNPKRDEECGLKWMTSAAEAGDIAAMRALATVKWQGLYGYEKDRDAAMSLLAKASELGDRASKYFLGLTWMNKDNSRGRDVEKALMYLEDAGRHGYVDAQSELVAIYYLDTIGIGRDIKKGLKWARRAAVHGDAIGEYVVASSYIRGEDCAIDYVKAIEWLKRAKLHGSKDASELLDKLEEKGWATAR